MKIKLTYTGKRMLSSGRLSHRMIDDKGEELFFKNLKWVFIGRVYEAEKLKSGIQIATQPEEVGRIDDEDKIDKWRAEEACAKAEVRERTVAKNADALKDLLEEIPKIKRFFSKLRGSDRGHFMSWLHNEIDREDREKLNREMNALFAKRLKRAKKSSR